MRRPFTLVITGDSVPPCVWNILYIKKLLLSTTWSVKWEKSKKKKKSQKEINNKFGQPANDQHLNMQYSPSLKGKYAHLQNPFMLFLRFKTVQKNIITHQQLSPKSKNHKAETWKTLSQLKPTNTFTLERGHTGVTNVGKLFLRIVTSNPTSGFTLHRFEYFSVLS